MRMVLLLMKEKRNSGRVFYFLYAIFFVINFKQKNI